MMRKKKVFFACQLNTKPFFAAGCRPLSVVPAILAAALVPQKGCSPALPKKKGDLSWLRLPYL